MLITYSSSIGKSMDSMEKFFTSKTNGSNNKENDNSRLSHINLGPLKIILLLLAFTSKV